MFYSKSEYLHKLHNTSDKLLLPEIAHDLRNRANTAIAALTMLSDGARTPDDEDLAQQAIQYLNDILIIADACAEFEQHV